MDIYSPPILALAANIPRLGRLPKPHATAKATSRLCGSVVIVDLCLENNTVSDFAQEIRACALTQAAGCLVGRNIVGALPEELFALRASVRAILDGYSEDLDERWEDFATLATAARPYKARHSSVMLIFDAIEQALRQILPLDQANAA